MKKRVFNVALALVLCLSLLPAGVFASGAAEAPVPAAKGAAIVYADYGNGFEFLAATDFGKDVSEQTIMLKEPVTAVRVVKGECYELDLDRLTLDGACPAGFERKLAKTDNDLLEVEGVMDFALFGSGELVIAARAPKALKGGEYSFKFPSLDGLEAVSSREYYTYVPGSNPGSFAADELTVPGEGYMLVSEMCHPASGHPDAPMDIYAADDGETLYIFFEAFLDNTFDHGKDFAAVHVKDGEGEKVYKVRTTEENECGRWWFEYTDSSEEYDWQHMCYVVEAPLDELRTEDGALALAFEYYGTSYGGSELRKLGIENTLFVSQSFMDDQILYVEQYGGTNEYADCPILPAAGEIVNSEGGSTAEGKWWVTGAEGDGETVYTLTLNGATLEMPDEARQVYPFWQEEPLSIYGNLIIELAEGTTNTINGSDPVNCDSKGIEMQGRELVIRGAGALNVSGNYMAMASWCETLTICGGAEVDLHSAPQTQGSSWGGTIYFEAIECQDIVVDGATLRVTNELTAADGVTNPVEARGMQVYGDAIILKNGGVIEAFATGGNEAGGNYALRLNDVELIMQGAQNVFMEGADKDSAEEVEELTLAAAEEYSYYHQSKPYVKIEAKGTLYPLWVANTQVSSLNAEDLTVIDGVEGEASYDPETNTLYLEDASIKTTSRENYDTTGVRYMGSEDFTISVSGDCSITEEHEDDIRSTGIVLGNRVGLVIIGEEVPDPDDFDVTIELAEGAVLTVTGGEVGNFNSGARGMDTGGIRNNSTGVMTISGAGTLNACGGGNGDASFGLYTEGDLILGEGATINFSAEDSATGNDGYPTGSSYGLGVMGDITIDGAVVTAEAGEGQYSVGVQTMKNIDLEDGELTSIAADAVFISNGINLGGTLTVNGGRLIAEAGELTAEGDIAGHGNSRGVGFMKYQLGQDDEDYTDIEPGIVINGGYVEARTKADFDGGDVMALELVPTLGEGVDAAASEDPEGEEFEEYNPQNNNDYRWFRVPFDAVFTVTFEDEDGTVLKTVEVPYGEMPEFGEDDPVKEEDDEYTYTFSGWDPELAEAFEDATYTAVFEKTAKEIEQPEEPAALYTITVIGGKADKDEAAEGDTVTITADKAEKGMVFDKWTVVTGSAVLKNESKSETSFTMPAEDVGIEAGFKEKKTTGGGGSSEPTYPVEDKAGKNGSVEVKPGRAAEGAKVTIVPKPDEGYQVDKVTVRDKDGNDIKVTDNGDGTYSFVMPAGSVSVSVSFTEKQHECPASKFGDVDLDAWYHQYLDYVLDKGIMEGVGGGRFAPQAATTRAMIVTMLHRLEGTPESGIEMPFDDVEEGLWYSEAVKWAAENGIVEGYGDGRFRPTDQITREQFVTIMHRYAQFKGIDVSIGEDTNILSYDDALDISDWAVSAMQWGVGSGLIEGRSYSLLVPQGSATRAEAATIFERFIEEIEK